MHNIERIQAMEQAFDDILVAYRGLSLSLTRFSAVQPQILELFQYYGSQEFHQDLSLDEQGKLPRDLKRGVLSEDGVYDLFEALQGMVEEMRALAGVTENNIQETRD